MAILEENFTNLAIFEKNFDILAIIEKDFAILSIFAGNSTVLAFFPLGKFCYSCLIQKNSIFDNFLGKIY